MLSSLTSNRPEDPSEAVFAIVDRERGEDEPRLQIWNTRFHSHTHHDNSVMVIDDRVRWHGRRAPSSLCRPISFHGQKEVCIVCFLYVEARSLIMAQGLNWFFS